MNRTKLAVAFIFSMILNGCKENIKIESDAAELPHHMIKKLTDIIVVDIFTPPVASRIYANSSLAMYEAIRFQDPKLTSIASKLNGFGKMPQPKPGKKYDFKISAIQSFCETAKKVTFSAAEISSYQDSLIKEYSIGLDKVVLSNSISFGNSVAAAIADRLGKDNYKETRGMERFEVKTDDKSRWVPTAPDYADALEPHWSKMMTMALVSPDQVKAAPFPSYSEDSASGFYKEMKEVFDISKKMTDEQVDITLFWDDNPFISKHKGHVMFQDKKMTPGGHWMAIAQKACRMKNTDFALSAKTYAYTAIGLYDAFISCWYEKYRAVRIRPQTAIQRLMDEQWISYLQTPPFPEYTSGHSTISSSAAEMLTELFGDGFAFTDSSELEYNLPVRSFRSFRQAAEEASISRVYGGIHFRSGCENGNLQGKEVAKIILQRLR
jgi:hypothetical protein